MANEWEEKFPQNYLGPPAAIPHRMANNTNSYSDKITPCLVFNNTLFLFTLFNINLTNYTLIIQTIIQKFILYLQHFKYNKGANLADPHFCCRYYNLFSVMSRQRLFSLPTINLKELETECPSGRSPMKSDLDDLFGTIGSSVDSAWRDLSTGKVGGWQFQEDGFRPLPLRHGKITPGSA